MPRYTFWPVAPRSASTQRAARAGKERQIPAAAQHTCHIRPLQHLRLHNPVAPKVAVGIRKEDHVSLLQRGQGRKMRAVVVPRDHKMAAGTAAVAAGRVLQLRGAASILHRNLPPQRRDRQQPHILPSIQRDLRHHRLCCGNNAALPGYIRHDLLMQILRIPLRFRLCPHLLAPMPSHQSKGQQQAKKTRRQQGHADFTHGAPSFRAAASPPAAAPHPPRSAGPPATRESPSAAASHRFPDSVHRSAYRPGSAPARRHRQA